jgi:hypothetical protein
MLKKSAGKPSEAAKSAARERRHGGRVDRVVAIRHRLAKTGNQAWSLSTTKNMSYSGLLFLSAKPYRKHDILEIQVVMSGVVEVYNGKAEVRRVVEIGSRSFDVGVKYLSPKAPSRHARSHLRS